MKLAARILFLAALAQPMLAQAATPDDFFRAVQVDDDRALKRMIEATFDPNVPEPARGENGLIVALREDSMRAFELLVRHPGIRVDQPATNGNTALMMAAFKGKRQAVVDLIERGAAVNRSGWTPLHYAAAGGDADIATLLLDRKANIDARAPTGTTPLMMAAQEGQQAVVRLLLARGANPYLVDNNKRTALRVAELADKRAIAKDIAAHMAANPVPAAAPKKR
ncbi:MAG TPA: ankyrin repeat domain-containing protein [Telluria sp.]